MKDTIDEVEQMQDTISKSTRTTKAKDSNGYDQLDFSNFACKAVSASISFAESASVYKNAKFAWVKLKLLCLCARRMRRRDRRR